MALTVNCPTCGRAFELERDSGKVRCPHCRAEADALAFAETQAIPVRPAPAPEAGPQPAGQAPGPPSAAAVEKLWVPDDLAAKLERAADNGDRRQRAVEAFAAFSRLLGDSPAEAVVTSIPPAKGRIGERGLPGSQRGAVMLARIATFGFRLRVADGPERRIDFEFRKIGRSWYLTDVRTSEAPLAGASRPAP